MNAPKILLRALTAILCTALSVYASAQDMIKGKIQDRDGHALIGATITLKSQPKVLSMTDENGFFSITAKSNDVLTVSYVGFEKKEVPVSGASLIVLNNNASTMNEVMVTALGIKKEVKRIGYSAQEVKDDELVKARDQNPLTGLAGKVAGLSVRASAEMLRKPTVLLRGNEITLYVVDGVPISSDTWNISPDDIESMTVLKGPTAAALYGSRAQYGAILITTKKGNRHKGFTVELNSTNSFDKGFVAFPRLQNEYGPGENNLYAFGDGKGGGLNDNDYDVWGPRFDGRLLPQWDGKYDPNTTYTTTFPGGRVWTGHIQPTPWIARGASNLQNFLRTGFQTTNNIALSATGDNYSLRFSLSHSYQQSIIPNMDLNISNFNLYGSYNISKKIKIDANLNFNRQYTPNYPDVDYGPNSLIYNIAVWTGADWDVNSPEIRGKWQPGKVGTQNIFAEYQRYHNPWFMVEDWLRGHYKSDIYGYVSTNYKINNNLNVNLRTQLTTYDLLRTEKMPYSAHPYGREGNMGDYRQDRRNLFENNSDLQLNYDYTIKHFLNLSGLVGGNIRLFSYNSNWASTDYLSIPNVYSFSNSLNPVQSSSFSSDMRVYSGYFSLDASLSKYATIGVTGRVDKSSALSKAHNSYFYPSISLATVVSDYLQLPQAISFLKFRGSYATVHGDATSPTIGTAPFNSITAFGTSPSGNSLYDYPLDYGNNYLSPYGGPDYSLVSAYNTSKPYDNQTAAYYTSNLYDPDIKPFNRVSYEEGFDIKFLRNRLGLSGTAFQYIDGPQILRNPISTATGYSYYYLNALKTRKTGYELSVSGTPVSNAKGLTWYVLANWSTYQDRYEELPPGQTVYNTFFHKGDRVDAFYSSAFVKTKDGQIIHDAAGKPLSNPVAQRLGYLNANFQWSINNNISYKNLSLGFQFDGSVGGVTTDYIHNKTMRGGRNIETIEGAFGKSRLDDDQHAGDPNYPGSYVGLGVIVSNNVPINYDSKTGEILNYKDLQFSPNTTVTHVQDYISKYYNISEANLMSKTYAKLREVTLTYTIPQQWISKSGINKLSVSLVGRNLIYFYADKRFKDVDLDQYNYSTTGTGLQSPTTRRYGFNINVVF